MAGLEPITVCLGIYGLVSVICRFAQFYGCIAAFSAIRVGVVEYELHTGRTSSGLVDRALSVDVHLADRYLGTRALARKHICSLYSSSGHLLGILFLVSKKESYCRF